MALLRYRHLDGVDIVPYYDPSVSIHNEPQHYVVVGVIEHNFFSFTWVTTHNIYQNIGSANSSRKEPKFQVFKSKKEAKTYTHFLRRVYGLPRIITKDKEVSTKYAVILGLRESVKNSMRLKPITTEMRHDCFI